MNSIMKYIIPSKTFVVGEYNVMFNGEGVLLATHPCFFIEISDAITINEDLDFHDFSVPRKDIVITGNDKAGFGKSSAGFLALFKHLIYGHLTENDSIDIKRMLEFYKSISLSKNKPSGADIVTQLLGNITIFANEKSYSVNWPFEKYEILIFKTKTKIKTYEHLSQDLHISNRDLVAMQDQVNSVKTGLKNQKIYDVINGINQYNKVLFGLGLVSEETQELLKEIKNDENILATKGCGALCNDVIITLNDKANSDSIKKNLESLGLKYTSSTDNLSGGLNVVC